MAKSSGSRMQLVGVRWQVRGDRVEVTRVDDPRCETCRWWVPLPPTGECRLGVTKNRPRAFPESKALAHGAGRLSPGGKLETAPDFGCIQWEPKE